METQVKNVRVAYLRPEYNNLKEWMQDPDNVYIGRRGIVFIEKKRFPPEHSLWANPFKGDGAAGRFEIYLRERLQNEPELVGELLKLKGKRLGCWCHPKSCHGDVLVKLIREYGV